MSRFNKRESENLPEISTASLPDIVFMLLFFFMTVTIMKDDTLKVENKLPNASEVGDYILAEIAKKPEHIRNVVTTALKIDKNANMGLISDIKQELRKVNALKINYTTYEGDAFVNLK
ncbi:MAG: biopolymer transporter ExbD [Flavobacteriaceae bacterium]|nr:MAG: biopolymer transporter ExbD [Flavobacteriaceae bacterium]